MNSDLETSMHTFNFHDIDHGNGKSLLNHSVNVANILKLWGEKTHVVHAGGLHSVYGTFNTQFTPLSHLERHQVIAVIGERAEELVYINCAMTPNSFWANFHEQKFRQYFFVIDRFNGAELKVTFAQLVELLHMNFANIFEQIDVQNSTRKFKWFELSLYIQYSAFLSDDAKSVLSRTCEISSGPDANGR